MISYTYNASPEAKPKHYWACKQCKFVGQITLRREGETVDEVHDIYESCSSKPGASQEYIIIHGEAGDYTSQLTQELLFLHYCIGRKPDGR